MTARPIDATALLAAFPTSLAATSSPDTVYRALVNAQPTYSSGDTTPPSAPTGLTVTGTTNNSVSLSWTAATDNVGVAGYDVYRNGAFVVSTTSLSYTDTGLSASTSYSYTVKAYDAASNLSAASNTATATTQAASDPVIGSRSLVFSAPYSDSSNWANGRTTAYPTQDANGNQTNPGDNKLDVIGPGYPRPTDAGVFTANRITSGTYNGKFSTGLVTTQGTTHGFKVQTNDVVTFDVTVSAVVGSWPGLWTWNQPSDEIDFFEYHGDNATTIEFTNHVTNPPPGYPTPLTPGTPSHVEVVCGVSSVQWWVDGVNVFNDTGGVGTSWSAYLIANLSVQATDQWHPGPAAGTNQITATIANVKVYR